MGANLPEELSRAAETLHLKQRPMRLIPRWVAQGTVDGVALRLRLFPTRRGLSLSMETRGPDGRHFRQEGLAGLEGRCEAWVREGLQAAEA
ncbi:MAG: hypothetical protein H6741_04005 [Alphaproteobacteria bacterium]|nr:hypothetical protein [Alphaproteobacteria bacterium]MCB9791870.1 hypothetical protein [Alphaproteobacteria bacterium]